MVATREASVSSPCLVLLLNLNAVAPTLSMHLEKILASHVLHRIQVSGVMGVPCTACLLPPSAALHLWNL